MKALPVSLLPWQVKPFKSTAPVLVLPGSRAGGKTRVAIEKAIAFARRYPGAVILVVRKAREHATAIILPEFMKRLAESDDVSLVSSSNRIEFVNGSVIRFCGLRDEQQAMSVRGENADMILVDEAIQINQRDYQDLTGCLRGQAGAFRQVILLTNPGDPNHWIYTTFIRDGTPDGVEVYPSCADDNQLLPADYRKTLDNMTGVTRKRNRDGIWAGAEGMVYADFDPLVHVLDALPDGHETWPIYMGFDWGLNHPSVALWAKADPDGRLYVYRQVCRTGMLADPFAKYVRSFIREEEIPYHVEEWGDHDGNYRDAMSRQGIDMRMAEKGDILAGIDQVARRLLLDEYKKPNLYFIKGMLAHEPDARLVENRHPVQLTEEITGYVYNTESSDPIKREKPIPFKDDGLDALRYLVVGFNRMTA